MRANLGPGTTSAADAADAYGAPVRHVFVTLKEIPMENWGLNGGIAGCDIDFGFKIRV